MVTIWSDAADLTDAGTIFLFVLNMLGHVIFACGFFVTQCDKCVRKPFLPSRDCQRNNVLHQLHLTYAVAAPSSNTIAKCCQTSLFPFFVEKANRSLSLSTNFCINVLSVCFSCFCCSLPRIFNITTNDADKMVSLNIVCTPKIYQPVNSPTIPAGFPP